MMIATSIGPDSASRVEAPRMAKNPKSIVNRAMKLPNDQA